ncbi:MAG: MBOAT family protein [Lachnospiraceae bacterium]|jgi:alginate O-acetyltransferase complex protein AlgI|nr:MBOAT family protein [Lachnospiraceae bacterium]
MIFNSLAFAVFFPVVFLLYWAVHQKYRWIFLLVSSYYFYMSWNAKYAVILLLITGTTYFCARMIEQTIEKRRKQLWMWLGVSSSFVVLFFFKYFNFVSESIARVFQSFSIPMNPVTVRFLLPIGISFYTFKAVSYILDVYRGDMTSERHFGYYALYLSFFPDLVSGPIDRAKELLPQLKKEKVFYYDEGVYGLKLMLLGFIKKLVIADALTKYVDVIFNNVMNYRGLSFVIASFLFTFQIYCDFSGYSDIAIGAARLLGIELMDNFKSPYFAQSIKEFWSRWHISLSHWFRDYIYIPLGGNRVKKIRNNWNIFITFLVSGLWHGASWNFVIWGGIHGLFQVIENSIPSSLNKRKGLMRQVGLTIGTFLLVNFAWIFFRANTWEDAVYFIRNMFVRWSISQALADLGMSGKHVVRIGGILMSLLLFDYFNQQKDLLKEMGKLWLPLRWLLYFAIVLLIVVLKIHNGTSQQFIYFQF